MPKSGSGCPGESPGHGASEGPPWLSRDAGGGWLIRVKAVPGASRDEIAGALGDRLKVRVAAAPEGGKANKAICKLIAKQLGMAPKLVEVVAGMTNPEKTIVVSGNVPREAMAQLNS